MSASHKARIGELEQKIADADGGGLGGEVLAVDVLRTRVGQIALDQPIHQRAE